MLLDGGDRAQRRRAYRLRLASENAAELFLWLSVFDDAGRPEIGLLKTGSCIDGAPAGPAVTYADWRDVGGVMLPHRRSLVEGLAENVVLELVTTRGEALEHVCLP